MSAGRVVSGLLVVLIVSSAPQEDIAGRRCWPGEPPESALQRLGFDARTTHYAYFDFSGAN